VFVLALIFFLLVTLLAVRKRWPVISRSARLLARAPFLKRWMESRYILIQSVENALLDFHHNSPRAFWGSFFLILASHSMAVMEVCLVLWLMGIKFGVLSALVVEAMTKLVNVVGSINPGNFGTYEGGNMLIGKTFGLTGATGLVLGLTRRLRGFFWAAVGGICLFILTRSRTPHDTHDRGSTLGIAEEKGGADADATIEVAGTKQFHRRHFPAHWGIGRRPIRRWTCSCRLTAHFASKHFGSAQAGSLTDHGGG